VLYMLLSRYLNLDKLTPRNQEDSLLLTVTETMDSTADLAGRPVKGAWIRENKFVRTLLLGWTLYGACCVMADGILTPAVSVISAVSGTPISSILSVAPVLILGIAVPAPTLNSSIVPISIGVLVVLVFHTHSIRPNYSSSSSNNSAQNGSPSSLLPSVHSGSQPSSSPE